MKKLICDNEIVMATKGYTTQQLRMFYYMLYNYKLNNDLVNVYNNIEEDEDRVMFIDSDKLKYIVGNNVSSVEICKIIDNMPWKICKFNKDKSKVEWISVFDCIEYYVTSREIEYIINPKFNQYVIELTSNFTNMDIDLFLQLESKYSQRLYELIRRYNGLGKFEMKHDDFVYFMGCPENYNSSNIDFRVINPSINELKKYGVNVKVEKIKKNRKIYKYLLSFNIDAIETGWIDKVNQRNI